MELKIQHQGIIPNEYFAQASSECQECFQAGYYFACITLCQAVAEALARFMCEKSGWKPSVNFERNIAILSKERIEPFVTGYLVQARGKDRNDFHHLNKSVPTDFEELRLRAGKKIAAINQAELQIFEHTMVGGLKPKYEKYWEMEEGRYPVYLRLDPKLNIIE